MTDHINDYLDHEGRAQRLGERNRANSPWPAYRGNVQPADAPLQPDTLCPPIDTLAIVPPGGKAPLILSAEHGARTMVRAIIANLDRMAPAYGTLECDLIETFGGFTSYPARGGWRDEKTGMLMIEPATVWEVSFQPDSAKIDLAILTFARAGHTIGERWVHIEQHVFAAQHVQVNP